MASQLLEKKLESKVDIGNMRLNMLGHVILDNVKLYDQQDTLMLQASRIAAKIDITPLFRKKIRISAAQLIGAKANLYKDGDEPFNFQYFIDAFSSKDTTSSPLDLKIGALVIRRGEVRFDMFGKTPSKGKGSKFDTNHLHLTDLSLTTRVHFKKEDSLYIDLRNLSFKEQSGLQVRKLSLEAEAGKNNSTVHNLKIELPNSTVSLTQVKGNVGLLSFKQKENFIKRLNAEAVMTVNICPHDLACIIPKLESFNDELNLSANAKMSNGTLRLPNISFSDNNGNLSLLLNASVRNIDSTPALFADIKELYTGTNLQQFLTRNLQGEEKELSPILTQLGSTKSSGTVAWQDKNLRTNLQTESNQGNILIEGSLKNMQNVDAKILLANLKIGQLLSLKNKAKGTTASVEASVSGSLPNKDNPAKLQAKGVLKSLVFNNYEHRNIPFSATLDGETIGGKVKIEELNGLAEIDLQTSKQQDRRILTCLATLKDFAPHKMNLTDKFEGEYFSGQINANFQNLDINNLQGELLLTDLELNSESKEKVEIGDVTLNSIITNTGQHITVQSNFLNIKADGNFNWKTIPASFIWPVRQNLPNLFTPSSKHQHPYGNNFRFLVQVQDTVLANRLLGLSLYIPQKSTFEGSISDAIGQNALQIDIPQVTISGQQLQNIDCRIETGNTALQTSIQGERIMKGRPILLNIDAYAKADKVTSRLRWDNKSTKANTGDISITSIVQNNPATGAIVDAKINNSNIVISDTIWEIQPATIKYHNKVIDVESLCISQTDKRINIGGRISNLSSDTLKAELANIDVSYIMDLVNFHKVEFDGSITGSIYATSLMEKPFADAFLQVKDFTFNSANLGNMDLYANWGKQERAITLDADMKGPIPQHRTLLHGTIIPGKGKKDGLNLNVRTSYFDLSFLSKFTRSIFSNLHGRASGWTRIFGPFKFINLEGDMYINELKTHVLATGADYHLAGDSVILRPDNIWLRSARIYDYLGAPGISEHTGIVDAHFRHNSLKNLRFDVNIDAHNILGYNFPNQGNMSFFGTVYADAKVHLSGEPGSVNINIDATPMPGTTINYNTATTGTIEESEFITYIQPASAAKNKEKDGAPQDKKSNVKEESSSSSDLRINFNIDANPNAEIRILMDPQTGDNISLYGNGRLRANYYNKGRFQLFGTYRVEEGNYRMSIRDLIRKDFTFQPDGTIVFGGNAMQASLNLKAIHTVPNVSLDDLSPTGLGLSNTRVDCIMNIGGIAREPAISFDFDIPNANEDEKQMVRSMMSSEEERDMQAVYLLGVGRFYSYGSMLDSKQGQGGMAMNSVLSGALSSRFNQIMSQALGGTGWTFGTNLRTGEDGWQELDVEGLVSGKMLSGRLIFNGNFGYRENKYKMGNSNFIGDFDIQYRLSPRSPFSLKAYNQTNDRYFTQSSLTTQGIGIKFQRDFNRWKELFRRAKKKEKK